MFVIIYIGVDILPRGPREPSSYLIAGAPDWLPEPAAAHLIGASMPGGAYTRDEANDDRAQDASPSASQKKRERKKNAAARKTKGQEGEPAIEASYAYETPVQPGAPAAQPVTAAPVTAAPVAAATVAAAPAAALPALDALVAGARVVIGGLQGRTELNGKHGTALSYDDAKGRHAVRVDGGSESLLLRRANLTVVSVGDEAAAGRDDERDDELDCPICLQVRARLRVRVTGRRSGWRPTTTLTLTLALALTPAPSLTPSLTLALPYFLLTQSFKFLAASAGLTSSGWQLLTSLEEIQASRLSAVNRAVAVS